MATDYKSDAFNLLDAGTRQLWPSDSHGKVRCASFQYTVPAGGIVAGKTVLLTRIPAGSVILGGSLAHQDVGNNISIGDGSISDKYLASTSMASASTAPVHFFATVAKYAGQKVDVDTDIVATSVGGAWTAGKVIKGSILYVQD